MPVGELCIACEAALERHGLIARMIGHVLRRDESTRPVDGGDSSYALELEALGPDREVRRRAPRRQRDIPGVDRRGRRSRWVRSAGRICREDDERHDDRQGSYHRLLFLAFSRSRSSTRRILPEIVLGSSVTNSISRGYLYGAVKFLQCSCSSTASASDAV